MHATEPPGGGQAPAAPAPPRNLPSRKPPPHASEDPRGPHGVRGTARRGARPSTGPDRPTGARLPGPGTNDDANHGVGPSAAEQDDTSRHVLGLILYVGKCSPANIAPNLLDATLVRELKGIIAGAAGDVTFDVLDLPGWSDAERHQLFQFVHSVRARARVRVGDKVYANLFEAALAAMVGTTDLAEHARSLQAAKEAAALLHPTLVEAAAARIDGRLTELGASNVNARTLASEIRTLARNHGAAGSAARPAGRRRPRGPNGTRARRQGPDRPEGKPVIVYLVSGIWMKAVWAGPGRDLEAVSARLGAHPRLRDSKFVCPKPSPERPELASARREIKRHLFGTSGDLIASIAATTAAAAPSHSAGRDKAK